MQLFIFPLCKFFQSQEQVLVGFLARPITGHYAHDHARYSEEQYDQYDRFHINNVPCSLPSISEIAIAEQNMPVMIHTMSISTIPCARS